MNKCMAEIYDPGGIRTRAARLISQYHNHWAKENSPNAVVFKSGSSHAWFSWSVIYAICTDIHLLSWVLIGSVVKCLTRNLGGGGGGGLLFPVFEQHWIIWVFLGVSLGKTLQSPSLELVKPRKDMNSVRCRLDMIEIKLKAVWYTSVN